MTTRAAYACALLMLALSFALYALSPIEREWSADNNDPADYRFVAEHFWGVPIAPETYYPRWRGGWGDYLRMEPFRGIGLGTLYLVAGVLRLGHAPRSGDEVLAAGALFSILLKAALAAALLILFDVVRRRWGATAALLTLGLTAFPPQVWRFCDDFLAEPVQRVLFLAAFACAVAMTTRERFQRRALLLMALFLFAAHLKQQWYVGAFLMLPVVLFQMRRLELPWRNSIAIGAAAVAIPLSVLAVNWIGWRTARLSPGIGIHVNLKYDGAVVEGFRNTLPPGGPVPAFADPRRPRLDWWNVYVGGDVAREDYDALDAYATRYVRDHAAESAHAFWEGLVLASSVPGIQRLDRGLVRLQPLTGWRALLVRAGDTIIWLLLLVGLGYDSTRLPCALALVLWIVPAIGNVFSLYELRYHTPMAGLGAAAGVLTVVQLTNLWLKSTR